MTQSTWGDAEGKWFYDCENDSDGNELIPIEPTLTTNQQLTRKLLQDSNYDPTIAPFDLTAVMLNFDLANANINVKKSSMESSGRLRAVNHITYRINKMKQKRNVLIVIIVLLFSIGLIHNWFGMQVNMMENHGFTLNVF